MRNSLILVITIVSSNVIMAQKAPKSGAGPVGAVVVTQEPSQSKIASDTLRAGASAGKEAADKAGVDRSATELINFAAGQSELTAQSTTSSALPGSDLWNTIASYQPVTEIAPIFTLKTMQLSKPVQLNGVQSLPYSVQFDKQASRVLVSDSPVRFDLAKGTLPSSTQAARLFDAKTGKELKTFDGPACFSGMQDKLIVGKPGVGGALKICEVASGACRLNLPHDGDISPYQTNVDDTRIVVCAQGKPTVHDMQSGKVIFELGVPKGAKISSLQFSPDGTKIVGEDSDHFAYIWNAVSGNLIKKIKIESGFGSMSAGRHRPTFNKDGTQLLAIDNHGVFTITGSIRIIDVASGKTVSIEVPYSLKSVAFNHNGTRIIGLAGKAMVWDAHNRVLLDTIPAAGDIVTAIDFNTDDTAMVLAGMKFNSIYAQVYHSPLEVGQLLKKSLTMKQMILLKLLESYRSKQEAIDWAPLAKEYDEVLQSFDAPLRDIIIRDYSLKNVGKR